MMGSPGQTPTGSGDFLCAKESSTPGRLLVGPCSGPFGGDYWVLDYKESSRITGGYAIIVGGQPDKWDFKTNRCGYLKTSLNGGMWIFTRERFPTAVAVDTLLAKMQGWGLDTSLMLPVPHEGCEDFDALVTETEQERRRRTRDAILATLLWERSAVEKQTQKEKTAMDEARLDAEAALKEAESRFASEDWAFFQAEAPRTLAVKKKTAASASQATALYQTAVSKASDYKLAVYDAVMSFVTALTDSDPEAQSEAQKGAEEAYAAAAGIYDAMVADAGAATTKLQGLKDQAASHPSAAKIAEVA